MLLFVRSSCGILRDKIPSKFLRACSISGLDDFRLFVSELVGAFNEESLLEKFFESTVLDGKRFVALTGKGFSGLVLSRLLEIVFSGINFDPVAFNFGMPLANKPPRLRGVDATEPDDPEREPEFVPFDGAVAALGLSRK